MKCEECKKNGIAYFSLGGSITWITAEGLETEHVKRGSALCRDCLDKRFTRS